MNWIFVVWVIGIVAIVVFICNIICSLAKDAISKYRSDNNRIAPAMAEELLYQLTYDLYEERGKTYLQNEIKNICIRLLNNGELMINRDLQAVDENGNPVEITEENFAELFSQQFVAAIGLDIEDKNKKEVI